EGEFGCILANSEAVQKRRSGMLRLPLKQAPGASQNRPRDSRFGANPLRVSVCGFRRSVGRGKDPIKGQNSAEFGFGRLSSPAALRAGAGNLLALEQFHCFDFGKRSPGALPLQADIVAALGANEDKSI